MRIDPRASARRMGAALLGMAVVGLLAVAPGIVAEEAGRQGQPGAGLADAASIARRIDEDLERGSETRAPGADDAEFLRRLYLDLWGVIPPAGEVEAFLDRDDPGKRSEAIDRLLASPRYGEHMAGLWTKLLFVRDSTNRRLDDRPLKDWLARRFNDNRPWDKLVGELLTATGTQEQNGATTFWIALRTPDKLNDQVCRLFLGVQLQCAQCHDHPFTTWKRDDYWSMAAFFSKVRAGGKKVGVAKNGVEVVGEGNKGKKAPAPETALDVPPRFLGGERPVVPAGEPYRPVLAKWLTAPDNPYFARAMVNRVWAQLFGRGFVDPVDNIVGLDSAAHPELFEDLTRRFASGGFDLKALIRGLCNSRAYQRASTPGDDSSGGRSPFAERVARPLSAEQLYDSLMTVLGAPDEPREARRKAAKKKGGEAISRERFVAFFQPPDGADPNDYPAGIPQVLRLMNSPETNRSAALLDEVTRPGVSPERGIERLYLATLSRRPAAAERQRLLAHVGEGGREAYADVLWVLLNSSEFALNH